MSLLDKNNMLQEIIGTPEFQRLKAISFLGILDYCFEGGKYSTRYDHSIAVADLCLEYSLKRNLSETEKTYIVLAGLLHDIGHCGFSHSLEPVFKERFLITHHDVTKRTITDSPNLERIWRQHNIDPLRIVDTIDGLPNFKNKVIATMPINFDTLDGIVRTEKRFSSSDQANHISKQVFHVLCNNDDWDNQTPYFDSFWEQKERIYSSFIYNEKGQTVELLFQHLFKNESSLCKEDFSLTDPELFAKFMWLSTFIANIKEGKHVIARPRLEGNNFDYLIKTGIRKFIVNLEGNFSPDENDRYLTSTEKKEYSFKGDYGFAVFR